MTENKQRKWPKGVRPITLNEFESMGIDKQQRLYWEGKPVETKQRLNFSGRQKIGAVLIIIGTLMGGFGACAASVDSIHNFGCKMHWWNDGCPKQY